MPFSTLAQIDLSENWQITPVTDGNYFRFVYRNNSGFSYLVVAQAQVGNDGLELFGSFRFALKGQGADVAQLEIPRVFSPEQRCIAVRGVGPARTQAAKSLDLLIQETTIMAIVNPSTKTNSTKFSEAKQDVNTAIEAVAANLNRNGGLIQNRGTKRLFVAFGSAADKGSPLVVAVGGNMDIPNDYTGPISVIWDAIDATPNNSSKAIITEFIA